MSDNHAEKYNQDQVDESERSNKIYQQTIALLQTEERFVNFFKNYNHHSVEGFIKYYAERKAHWYAHDDSQYHYRLSKKNRWRYAAVNMLKEIFFKKLFNLKCRWVAGEMDLQGIHISNDFAKWEHDPSSCNAVEPITPEEFNCYMEFLQDEARRNKDEDDPEIEEKRRSFLTFEFYHWHKADSVDGYEKYIPRWYYYYDARFGTAPLLHLSNIRKDLEVDYHDIYSEEIYKKTLSPEQIEGWDCLNRLQRKELSENPEKRKAYHAEQNRKWEEREKKRPKNIHLSAYDRKIMKELVTLAEPPEVRELYHATVKYRRKNSNHDEIDMDLIYLHEAKECIAVEPDDDYRNAIKNASEDYTHKKKMEALPVLFDEYCQCLSAGKPFDWKTDSSSKARHDEMGDRILAARKWKGEPGNFDFLKKENLKK